MLRYIRYEVVKLCEMKSREILTFWAANFRGKGQPKLLTEFYKDGLSSNMWQSLVTIGQANSEIMRQIKKNKDVNDSAKQWPVASGQTSLSQGY